VLPAGSSNSVRRRALILVATTGQVPPPQKDRLRRAAPSLCFLIGPGLRPFSTHEGDKVGVLPSQAVRYRGKAVGLSGSAALLFEEPRPAYFRPERADRGQYRQATGAIA